MTIDAMHVEIMKAFLSPVILIPAVCAAMYDVSIPPSLTTGDPF